MIVLHKNNFCTYQPNRKISLRKYATVFFTINISLSKNKIKYIKTRRNKCTCFYKLKNIYTFIKKTLLIMCATVLILKLKEIIFITIKPNKIKTIFQFF